MDFYFLWTGIGILTFFLVIGFLCGLVRGLKRSSLHIIFFAISIVVAFCITKTVTDAVMEITITANGQTQTISQFILSIINQQLNLGSYETADAFLGKLPAAIISPILFIILCLGCFILFDIFYLIVARIAFGRKKEDFKKHKAHRWLGSFVGVVEGFLFMFVLFAPLTALTKTYSEITTIQTTQTQTSNQAVEDGSETTKTYLQTIPELLNENIPKEVNDSISAYNNSILGKVCGAGGLDKALFDGLSNFKLNGEKIKLRSELLNLTDTYNNFVVVYNNYIDANFAEIDLTKLKANIETFLNNGIFKTVVADTLKEFVVSYNPTFDPENPQQQTLIDNILLELKATFSQKDFNMAQYLKEDISKAINIADKLFKSKLLSDMNEIAEKTTLKMMEVVGQNNDEVQVLIDNVFELNLIKDSFKSISDFLKDTLKDSGNLIDVESVESTASAWERELSLLGKSLEVLATNKIEVKVEGTEGTVEKTYVAYILEEGEKPADHMQVLLKDMTAKNVVSKLFEVVFDSQMFKPLTNTMFTEIDKAIEGITGVAQTTDTTVLQETKASVIQSITQILDFALNLDLNSNEIQIQSMGKVLDVLKQNAKSHTNETGKFDGVFNETFVNLIWFLTGDSIDGRSFEGKNPISYAGDVKKYLNVEDVENGYYNFESFENTLKGIQDVINIAQQFEGVSAENVADLVTDITNVFETMEEQEKLNLIDTAQKALETANIEIIPEDKKSELQPKILEKLEELKTNNTISSDVAEKLKTLLGLTA